MQEADLSTYIVCYNFVIGILIMLSSDKVAAFAGNFNRRRAANIERLARTSMFTFGACIAAVSGFIYVAFHLLKIGV
jgi:hypothetical protein